MGKDKKRRENKLCLVQNSYPETKGGSSLDDQGTVGLLGSLQEVGGRQSKLIRVGRSGARISFSSPRR